MKYKSLVSLLLLMTCSVMAFPQQLKLKRKLEIKGELINHKWSKDSRYLAVLYTDPQEQYKIVIVKTKSARLKKTYKFPFRITAFDWMIGGQAFLLARANKDYSYNILEYNLKTEKLQGLDDKIERLFQGVSAINIAPETDLWALTFFAEGLVDTAVYQQQSSNITMVFFTEVYGGVSSLFWKGGLLYCQSFVDLEMGLTEKERLAYFIKQGWGKEAEYYNSEYYMGNQAHLFGLDIKEKQAYMAHDIVQKEMDYSFDKAYYALIRPDTNKTQVFSVSLYHTVK